MLSLLGSLLGFAGSAAPAVMDHITTKQNNYDMKMFEKQAADKEHERLIQHDTTIAQSTGFIAGLQKSVRPVITYAFFGLFATIEITLLMDAIEKGTEFNEAIQLLWDDDTKAIFAAIISFWFGSRAIDKARSKK